VKKVYAVVHIADMGQAMSNVYVAKEAGCDGVFLISHGDVSVWKTFEFVRRYGPEFWVGVNDLRGGMVESLAIAASYRKDGDGSRPPDGIWTDHAGISDNAPIVQPIANYDELKEILPDTQYFGGVAFKYQGPVTDVRLAAANATHAMDVVVTSGEATGDPPSLIKIQRMHEGCGNKLGVASGITPENVNLYLPYVSHFLVATGISRDFHTLDLDRTAQLVKIVRDFS